MSDMTVKQEAKYHKKEVQNLAEKHALEIEKTRLNHTDRLHKVRAQNKDQLAITKLQGNEKLLEATRVNEEKLMALQKNLEQTREFVDNEKEKIRSEFLKNKEERKKLHELNIKHQNMQNSMAIEDMNHKTQTELSKLQKISAYQEATIRRDQDMTTRKLTSGQDEKYDHQKKSFSKVFDHNNDKFQFALQKQKFDNQKTIADAEKKKLNEIQDKELMFNHRMANLQKKREATLAKKNAEFEKDFNKVQNDNKDIIQNVVAKREKLLNNLKQDLWKEFQLAAKKADDPFYDFGKLEMNVVESEDKKGYQIEVPAAEHAAGNIRMTAEKRNLKLMMDRKHEFTKESEERKDSVFKNESYVTNLHVEDIIEPDSLKKTYHDGKVIFTIKKA